MWWCWNDNIKLLWIESFWWVPLIIQRGAHLSVSAAGRQMQRSNSFPCFALKKIMFSALSCYNPTTSKFLFLSVIEYQNCLYAFFLCLRFYRNLTKCCSSNLDLWHMGNWYFLIINNLLSCAFLWVLSSSLSDCQRPNQSHLSPQSSLSRPLHSE